MIRVIYSGQFRDVSGYGQAARGYLHALHVFMGQNPGELDLRVNCVQYTGDTTISGEDADLIRKYEFSTEAEAAAWIDAGDFIFIGHHTPPSLHQEPSNKKYTAKAKKLVSLTVWETSKVPDLWVKEAHGIDVFIVPCEWNGKIFREQTKKEAYVLPHVVDIQCPTATQKIIPGACNFLAVSQWTPRKGWDALVMAFLMEFHGVDDAVLVVKSSRDNTSAEEQKIIRDEIAEYRERVTVAPLLHSDARVLFIGGLQPPERMEALYHGADVFVLASRGEGFGLPYSEAIARRVPVICPAFGGHIDFIDPDNNYLIDGSWEPCHTMGQYYTSDMLWFEPSVSSLRKQLRRAYDDYKNGVLNVKGDAACAYVAKRGFDAASVGERFYNILEKIGG